MILTANLSTASTSSALHRTTTVVDGVSVTVTAAVPLPLIVAEEIRFRYRNLFPFLEVSEKPDLNNFRFRFSSKYNNYCSAHPSPRLPINSARLLSLIPGRNLFSLCSGYILIL